MDLYEERYKGLLFVNILLAFPGYSVFNRISHYNIYKIIMVFKSVREESNWLCLKLNKYFEIPISIWMIHFKLFSVEEVVNWFDSTTNSWRN